MTDGRPRPTADAASRIRSAYHNAEAPVLRLGSNLREVDQFARELRAIDLTGAPDDVERAMNALIVRLNCRIKSSREGTFNLHSGGK